MTHIIPKRVVIDTNVCLDLFVFKDPRWSVLLSALQNNDIQAVTRHDCRDEWLAVLKYPHLPVVPEELEQITGWFDTYIPCVTPTEPSTYKLPVCTDKDDQKFLEIARDAQAQVLITKDKALLKLARKMKNAGMFLIQTPEQFLLSYVKECDKTASHLTKA
ncbi:putative toxin-antitoxin system toxin component, PIN family [Undibacterium sp. CY18W]|uniref:Toxin-antitoxin system toxin component, PIN family n=1 Tax=Undibacterium hunanense TaxID=2762292 RepID=A0ABR6ZK18_9BURK|nr:putative toxin-antitoxin system toxin component, PIN family [Undibacterium hunanense]MBC3916251.1 putative toxin-antitoxin system toxin component, PIN family [Undibacterium hunanense]